MIFGFFGKKTGDAVVKKHAPRVAEKRTQAPDRWDSIQALGQVISDGRKDDASDEAREHARMAVAALLPRFNFNTDPSITDNDEKEEVARLAAEAGEIAIAPVVAFLRKSDAIGWPLKILERVGSSERVVTELLSVLSEMDTEYERDPSRKLHMLQALEDRPDARVCPAIARFLDDVNEGARFHTVGALMTQEGVEAHKARLDEMLVKDDSVRVRARIIDAYAERGWDVGADRDGVIKALPTGWKVDKSGLPVRL